jgi:hypothetical protein
MSKKTTIKYATEKQQKSLLRIFTFFIKNIII